MKHSIKSPAIPKNTVSDNGEKVLITFFFLAFSEKSATGSEYFYMKRTKPAKQTEEVQDEGKSGT